MAFKMNGFNKPKNINDSSVFKSNAGLMMRNAALFQMGKEQDTPSDRKPYFVYDEDNIPYKIKDTDSGGGYQPTEASVERAARQEGYFFEKREDGTNRMSDSRARIRTDDAGMVHGYYDDAGKYTAIVGNPRSLKELERSYKIGQESVHSNSRDFDVQFRKFKFGIRDHNARAARTREMFRRLAEFKELGGRSSKKPGERYQDYLDRKEQSGKKK